MTYKAFNNRPLTNWPVHCILRLDKSLPREALEPIKLEMEAALLHLDRQFTNRHLVGHPDALAYREHKSDEMGRLQRWYDRLLDKVQTGPMFLADPRAKQVIIDNLLHLAKLEGIEIFAICVMSNHVHMLLRTKSSEIVVPFVPFMERHKRYTGRKIKQLKLTEAERVWARKAFDRDVRPGRFWVVLNYILQNPVKIGLVDRPLDFCGMWVQPGLIENSGRFFPGVTDINT